MFAAFKWNRAVRASLRRWGGQGGLSVMPLEGNFIPASYTCIPLHQLSPCFAPHTVLSGDACSKWTHTPTHTHSQIPVTGGEGVSSTTSSVIFIGVKVSDSFRVLQTDDYIWSQLNEKSEAVCFSFFLCGSAMS